MRIVFIGFFAAVAFAAANGAIFHFSGAEESLLYYGVLGLLPVDWLLIGIWMGLGIGLSYRGIDQSDFPLTFASGSFAALFCTFLTHAVQFVSIAGSWDLNGFIIYLGAFGESWNIGPWYMWLSTALASAVGGFAAVGLTLHQRADNIRRRLPSWVSPTCRILIHIARADGHMDTNEVDLIVALVRAQMLKTLDRTPKDMEAALADVIRAEVDAIKAGRTLNHELKEKCFSSTSRRESVAKLSIALAQCDGVVSDDEAQVLDMILDAWKITGDRRSRLAAEAYEEMRALL